MNYKTYGVNEVRTFAHENSINAKLHSGDVIILFTELEVRAVVSALEKGEKQHQVSKQYGAQGEFENFIVKIE